MRSEKAMFRKLLVLVMFLSAAGTLSAATTVTFQEGVNGYTGTLDTTLYFGDPTNPHGEDTDISVDEDFGGSFPGATQGVLRFDNIFGSGPGQIPTGVTVGYAELQIWVSDECGANCNIRFLRVLGAPGANWDENSTWDSLGGDFFSGAGDALKPIVNDGVEALATPDFSVPDTSLSDFFLISNATAALQAWHGGAANRGWAVNQDTTGGWDFQSSETADETERPKLTVVYYQPGKLGDIDSNNVVNLADYQMLLNNMGLHVDGPVTPGFGGDLNFDRRIDPADFGIFKTEFPGGAGAFEAALAASVPEPASVVLVLMAVGGVACWRRRRMA
jgi:hypothetical protein